ncbi:FAD-dependent monooxygenase [Phaeovulum sp.]|uniref:FAD-dependent monooxygenase n=1 Tax=Phaeovulum sp. TaxID=2934796 RepID=UPI0027305A97|nr:FAD-dependent monooxygenase [Phaeovulum sp.]MDP1668918.1 FAD-dependent monooxygenase [Phaeovulum sp.]MDZ4119189.1 FAD-dependent monooxygenase [Phaeovulum sp.]
MKHDSDVVIAGGGLNGPALALALAGAGLRVSVVDAQAPRARAAAGFDGRAYALAIASQRLLAAVGVWPAVSAKAQPIWHVHAADGRAGERPAPFGLRFDAAELEGGPVGYMLEDRFLAVALADAMAASARISFIPATSVIAHEPGSAGVSVTLSDGRGLTARVLVGADGRRSDVAERAGIRRTGWGYGQTALVCALDHECPHNGVAQQVFLPTGPLAILPLSGNRSSIVWSETDANARTLASLADADFLALLRTRLGDHLGQIALAGPRFSYPLNLTLANAYVAPRVALVGDAAHGVHPIAGQGLNLGLRDVAVLAEVLVEAARRGEDIGAADVLDRYQGWRRVDATLLALSMDAVNKLFSNDNPLLRAGRDLGLGLVQSAPFLRRAFMRQAAGLSANPPRLLAGQQL